MNPVRLAPGEAYECIFKIKVAPSDSTDSPSKTMKDIEQFSEL
jgi:hypothetical protein